ncbi:hypothetical protein [Roseicitreum antarcticum]|uniref:Succinate dehydrogenase n=1 Tax=Roseicitreum antarcticum TaxID=564137 RepID=A0A1H2XE44_9RHOB|nr:hypothetical protein [Roseicitreum antarcticum]SDW90744.1 hypothetical protein SAMN04488238_104152 [Roseicitreum antarcticum]
MRALPGIVLAGSVLALAACGPMQDQIARDTAKRAVRPVLAQNFPGVPLDPAVDCVIDQASAADLSRLAVDGALGAPSEASIQIVLAIARRPATLQCIATDGLAPFLR